MRRLGGGLEGCHVLEVGCGGGYGVQLILEVLGAESVDAIDMDPVMVRRAERRLGTRAQVRIGDMVDTAAAAQSYDAVVEMGAMHLEPRWRDALRETRRVLKPGGRFYFEEIVRPFRQAASALATSRRVPRDFAKQSVFDELERLNFTVHCVKSIRLPALTGMVGDIIAVAAVDP